MSSSYTHPDSHSDAEQFHIEDSLALHKLSKPVNDNESGFCQNEDCGVQIPQARLELIPNARFCVHCQALNDKKPIFVCRNHYVP